MNSREMIEIAISAMEEAKTSIESLIIISDPNCEDSRRRVAQARVTLEGLDDAIALARNERNPDNT